MTDAADTPQADESESKTPITPTAEQYAAMEQRLKSLEGRDKALTQTTQEKKQLEADLAAARETLAEYERQGMSELEKAQKERDKARQEAAEAKAEAAREKLARKYPNAVELLEGEPLPSEEKLEAMEKALVKKEAPPPSAQDEEPEPIVNNPPKTRQVVDDRTEVEKARDALREAGPAEYDLLTK